MLKYKIKKFPIPSQYPITHGYGNGYIYLPKNHIYHGVDYWDLPEEDNIAHGGFTFSEPDYFTIMNSYVITANSESRDWILGFDTGHPYDTLENWPKYRVLQHTKFLAMYYDKKRFYKNFNG